MWPVIRTIIVKCDPEEYIILNSYNRINGLDNGKRKC